MDWRKGYDLVQVSEKAIPSDCVEDSEYPLCSTHRYGIEFDRLIPLSETDISFVCRTKKSHDDTMLH